MEKNKSVYIYIEDSHGSIFKMERTKLLKTLETWDEFVIRLKDFK